MKLDTQVQRHFRTYDNMPPPPSMKTGNVLYKKHGEHPVSSDETVDSIKVTARHGTAGVCTFEIDPAN
jgi:hypothetical protein